MDEFSKGLKAHFGALDNHISQIVNKLETAKLGIETGNREDALQALQQETQQLRSKESLVSLNANLSVARSNVQLLGVSADAFQNVLPARIEPNENLFLEYLLFRDVGVYRAAVAQLRIDDSSVDEMHPETVMVFERLHAIVAAFERGDLDPLLSHVSECHFESERDRRTVTKLIRLIVVDAIKRLSQDERPAAVKKYLQLMPDVCVTDVLLGNEVMPDERRRELIWRVLSAVTQVPLLPVSMRKADIGDRKRSADSSGLNDSEIILLADPEANEAPRRREPLLRIVAETATSHSQRIALTDPPVYIPDSDDDASPSEGRTFAQSRAVIAPQPRRTRPPATSAYYPHQQSREYIIGQLASRHAQPDPVKEVHRKEIGTQTETWVTRATSRIPPLPRLESAMLAGLAVIPKLLEAERVSIITQSDWRAASDTNFIAVEADVPASLHTHSFIACPITHRPCDSISNRPMLLACGHVVSERALADIIQSTHRSKALKCPVCPREFAAESTQAVSF